jgi:hypothetical protein
MKKSQSMKSKIVETCQHEFEDELQKETSQKKEALSKRKRHQSISPGSQNFKEKANLHSNCMKSKISELKMDNSSFNYKDFMLKIAEESYKKLPLHLDPKESRFCNIAGMKKQRTSLWIKITAKIILANRALLAFAKVKKDILDYGTSKYTETQETKPHAFNFIILPTYKIKLVWDFITMVLLLYTATFVPFKLAFLDSGNKSIVVIDLIVDVLFGVDIIANFVTAYFEDDYRLITSHCRIASRYIKTWFIFDLIVCFPFQLIIPDNQTNQYNGLVRLLKLPRLYRILRIVKLVKVFESMQNNNVFIEKLVFKLLVNAGIMRLIQTLITLVLFIHIFACLWFLIARFFDFTPETW